jgi:hypothetical protein
MPLFQESIVKKHLSKIDESVIESAYLEYKRVYSPEKIKNIKTAKEEQYQEGFIKDVFGSVLGYSVYPEHPYNIETEKKNETNSKKADGAILKDEKVVGVIELKDNKTKNLEAVKDQAFGYKHNHKECSYVISSNFHKLRFYIDDATDYEEFDLYNLDKDTFKRFYLYLRKEGLLDKNLPKLLREETKFHEEEISKKLYKDYSNFKRSFYENAVKNNPDHDKLILFKKSQKFLDRILFLLFAEDKGLVGTNSIVNIVEKWSGTDDDYYRPLYEMVNTYFGHLYRGYTYQKTGEVIPQFGGELFAPDEVLEVLKIDDDILKNDLLVLSKYDFNTDVDVNILGHIFEHSLNEVDDVEAELRGEQLDKTKSKRKKDGVFYTPKYITKYIVDNTLGKLCNEKKAELKLDHDIAIFDNQKADGKLNEKGKDLYERLNTYKSWLLTLKVCDPACGSGAFLNQALSFFIEEHKFVDDIIAELTKTPLRLFDTDLQILENNIFGVDINDESIEIAKLSLWLRTAQSGRKLSDLSNNIKCGNSLIDDPTVAGDKAFSWSEQFPEVFNKGGFDVIIGNPPYGASLSVQQIDFFRQKYQTVIGHSEVYYLFTEKAINDLAKSSGLIGYIIPNAWLSNKYAKDLRKLMLSQTQFNILINFNQKTIFEDANVETSIFIIKNETPLSDMKVEVGQEIGELYQYDQNTWFQNDNYLMSFAPDSKIQLIIEKLNSSKTKLSDFLDISNGIKPYQAGYGLNKMGQPLSVEDVNNKIYHSSLQLDDTYKPEIKGKGVNRYSLVWEPSYISWGRWLMSPKGQHYFEQPKILLRQIISSHFYAHIDTEKYYADQSLYVLTNYQDKKWPLEFFLALLNSRLYGFYFRKFYSEEDDLFPKIKVNELKNLPVKIPSDAIKDLLIAKAIEITETNKSLSNLTRDFECFIQSKLGFASRKLTTFWELEFKDFLNELKKNKVKLSISEESEWMTYFNDQKQKGKVLKSYIDQTDKEIDQMVYELYGLTEEEVQIIENR